MNLYNITLDKQRVGLKFGLNKQILLDPDKLYLDLGIYLNFRKHFSNKKNYNTEFISNNENWIKFNYDLTTYHDFYIDNNGTKTYGNKYNSYQLSKFKIPYL